MDRCSNFHKTETSFLVQTSTFGPPRVRADDNFLVGAKHKITLLYGEIILTLKIRNNTHTHTDA